MRNGFCFLLVLLLAACGSQNKNRGNLAHLYDPQNMALRPSYRLEHKNDSTSVLHYRINSENLLYQRSNNNNRYEAKFEVSYSVAQSLKNPSPLDSGRIRKEDFSQQVRPKTIEGEFFFKTPRKNRNRDLHQFILFLNIRDINRQSSFGDYLSFSKSGLNAKGYFELKDTAGHAIFKNHLPSDVPFVLEHPVRPSYYYARFYQRDFPLALPPYSKSDELSFELNADSVFLFEAEKAILLPQKGFYHFQLDTNQWEGYTILNFSPSFPMVGSYEEMAGPLRYITTQREFKALQAARQDPEALRAWIENFWMQRAGSKERARDLIKAFYSRVEEANRLFSSYHEGWKTDRGILYVVYGPPAKVYRNADNEDWVYGNESSTLSFYFRFYRVNNPFTDNDYELDRNPIYRYGWGQAVEAWRQGRVYGNKEIRRLQDEQDQLQYRSRNPMWY